MSTCCPLWRPDPLLPVTSDRSGFEDELACLRDEHEEPLDVGVGDRDRTTALDLGGEHVNDGSARTEHVAEPHRDVAPGMGPGERGRQSLGEPLGEAEHGRRVGGLVRRDVDEGSHRHLGSGGQHVQGADHIGLPALERVRLHQRQVLERRGVEHQLGCGRGEDRAQGCEVTDVRRGCGGLSDSVWPVGQVLRPWRRGQHR